MEQNGRIRYQTFAPAFTLGYPDLHLGATTKLQTYIRQYSNHLDLHLGAATNVQRHFHECKLFTIFDFIRFKINAIDHATNL